MITLDQARDLTTNDRVHFTGDNHQCTRTVGPRGGVTVRIMECRINGALKTWKREPNRWLLPVKYGMRTYGTISNNNNQYWHVVNDCPLASNALNFNSPPKDDSNTNANTATYNA